MESLRSFFYPENSVYSKMLQVQTAILPEDFMEGKTVQVLYVPSSLLKNLQQCYQSLKTKEDPYFNISWNSLRKYLSRDHHDIFYVTAKFKSEMPSLVPFIFASKEISIPFLLNTMKEWSSQVFKEDIISTDGWEWKEVALSTAFWSKEYDRYSFFVAYLHHVFAEEQHFIRGIFSGSEGQNEIPFHFVIEENGSTSLISEPIFIPLPYPRSKEKKVLYEKLGISINGKNMHLPVSYQLRFKLITKPEREGTERIYINVETNLKRYPFWDVWNDMSHKNKINLLVLQNPRYQTSGKQIGVELNLEKDYFSKKMKLSSPLESSFLELELREGVTLKEVMEKPYHYMQSNRDLRLFPIFNNRYLTGWKNEIEVGIGLPERNEFFLYTCAFFGWKPLSLFPLVSGKLPRAMTPVSEHPIYVDVWDSIEKKVYDAIPTAFVSFMKADTEVIKLNHVPVLEEWEELLCAQMSQKEPINFEKTNKTPSCYKHRAIILPFSNSNQSLVNHAKLFMKKKDKEQKLNNLFISFVGDEVKKQHECWILTKIAAFTMIFTFREKKSFGMDFLLPIEKKEGSEKKWILDRTKKQILDMKTSDCIRNTVSRNHLFNIPDYHVSSDPFLKEADPKKYLRNAFAKCGKVVQFINGETIREVEEEKDLTFALLSSIRDLLKDAFVHPVKNYTFFQQQSQCWIGVERMRIRLLKRNYDLILACLIRTDNPTPHFAILNDGQVEWKTYEELLMFMVDEEQLKNLFRHQKHENLYKNRESVAKFFESQLRILLRRTLKEDEETFVVFQASLRSPFFSFLQNGEVCKKPYQFPENVHFIRYNNEDEVPGGDTLSCGKGSWSVSKNSGVYWDVERDIFYSVGSKPDTDQKSPSLNKEKNPQETILRPRIREVIVMGEEGERAKIIACLVHGMRNTLITFNKEGAEILPISYLHSLKKYLPI